MKQKGPSMKKKILFALKLVATAGVVGFVYFAYFMPSLSVLFNFEFMSKDAWHEKWAMQFASGNWVIKNLSDVLLLFMMVMWVPLYFMLVWLFMKIRWKKFRFKPKAKTVVKKALDLKKDKQVYAKPRAMPSTVQATKYVAPRLPGQEESQEKKATNKSHKNVLQMIKQMAVVARKFKVEIFQHIVLEGYKVPMAVSTAARAIMIEIVNRNDVNWSVDFNDDVLQSNWYSEGGVMENMVSDLVNASIALEKAEPGSEVIKVICLTDGRILNAKQTVDYFKKHDIHLLVFNNGLPKTEILDFSSFISAHFELKEGEIDPALVKLPKVPLRSETKGISENEEDVSSKETEEEDFDEAGVPSFEEDDFTDDDGIMETEFDEDVDFDFIEEEEEPLSDTDTDTDESDAETEESDDEEEELVDLSDADDNFNDEEEDLDAEEEPDFQGSATDTETISQVREHSAQESDETGEDSPQTQTKATKTDEDDDVSPFDEDETDDADEEDGTFDGESEDNELFEQRLKAEDATDEEEEFVSAVAKG